MCFLAHQAATFSNVAELQVGRWLPSELLPLKRPR